MISKAKLKQYKQLHSKKFRQKYGLFVVEGLKSVNELIRSSWSYQTVLCTLDFIENLDESLDIKYELISKEDFKSLSTSKNPQEILAIAKIENKQIKASPWTIALDDINDPGNLGTIIRIADWYGINTIYCSEQTVDLYNNKVIQSTMGSFLRVSVVKGDLQKLLVGKTVYASLLNGTNIREIPKSDEGVILIGNEANGISDSLLEKLTYQSVTIPGNSNTESLNAAIATAISCERLLG